MLSGFSQKIIGDLEILQSLVQAGVEISYAYLHENQTVQSIQKQSRILEALVTSTFVLAATQSAADNSNLEPAALFTNG